CFSLSFQGFWLEGRSLQNSDRRFESARRLPQVTKSDAVSQFPLDFIMLAFVQLLNMYSW
ncbi:hypothetical protein, partial [Nitrolancea hollandica]|uniref:hypothetical protein n=1 Tax=Nitrolancea hollandica TaxID=1206749 RepID=UPI001EE67D5E